MKKLYLALQTPTIEITLEAIDGAGKKDTVIVGFNRYDSETGKTLLKEFQGLLGETSEEMDEEATKVIADKIQAFVVKEVSYLKKVSLKVGSEGEKKLHALVIPDTRLEKEREDFWETPEEALETLLELLLSADLWYSEFVGGVIQALSNIELKAEEEELKN